MSITHNKYQNKYRLASSRLAGYNYSQNGAYFITICTKNKTHFFGIITDGKMTPSPLGLIAHKFWQEIPKHFSSAALGESVVMPNHVHGIIIINNPSSIPSKTISLIINQYKRASTIEMRQTNPAFAWQPRFHDRVIRDENDFYCTSEYITQNPKNWKKDNYY